MKPTIDIGRAYQDSAAQAATPIELVILLYDSAIDDMRRALSAMQKGEIELRSAQIGHALMVLQQLQGTLDFDRGGEAARQFEQFYSVVRAKLLEAQIRGSGEMMQQQIRCMSEVRDCWTHAKGVLQAAPVMSAATVAAAEGGSASEWNA